MARIATRRRGGKIKKYNHMEELSRAKMYVEFLKELMEIFKLDLELFNREIDDRSQEILK